MCENVLLFILHSILLLGDKSIFFAARVDARALIFLISELGKYVSFAVQTKSISHIRPNFHQAGV